ncbi:DHA2 family efflux MFS transporter permease subunit [Loigolactobacillus bifermentans]|uniref:Multidrug transporter n=1 Tax=Loigolactobacillus bifermentans DSM 20003 TaxID=1423726 RepID=A0A0R1GSP7_9LACO|nr:DHA2 family efflux MFS transporter permease subunit [Loigolactobacillus bifermentans]KRK34530.1 Multidrug transporter [Loigolactobacillus bifermentans DSM 20003]QGG61306.1 DHA2 family efflux MFS transporter permease subunit [Loigolactobacillus bifermentans]
MEKNTTRPLSYHRGLLVAVVIIGAFVSMLNQTVLSVAQPSLINAFHINVATAQWLSTGYALIGGILIPISAWLADRFNTKSLLATALALFLLGTVLAFLAGNFPLLLTARLVQAIGAGILSGLTMTVLFSVYNKAERGTPTMLLGVVFGIAPAVGPTLGGYLVDHFGWRAIFGAMAPIILIALLMALFFMADVVPHKTTPLDALSVISSTGGFGGILYGVSVVSDSGWTDAKVVLSLLLGVALVAVFIWRQLTIAHPMLELRIFSEGNFTIAAVIAAIAQISMVAVEFILPLYLQNARGLSAMNSGLALLPGALLMFLLAPISGRLVTQNKGRQTVLFGITVMTLSTFGLAFMSLKTPIWYVVALYACRNVGLTFAMMPAGTMGMHSLTPELISHGSAGNNVVRQVGAAIGTAVLVSVLQSVSTHAAPQASLLQTNRAAYATGMHQALVSGAQVALLVATGIGAVGIICALCLKNPQA